MLFCMVKRCNILIKIVCGTESNALQKSKNILSLQSVKPSD